MSVKVAHEIMAQSGSERHPPSFSPRRTGVGEGFRAAFRSIARVKHTLKWVGGNNGHSIPLFVPLNNIVGRDPRGLPRRDPSFSIRLDRLLFFLKVFWIPKPFLKKVLVGFGATPRSFPLNIPVGRDPRGMPRCNISCNIHFDRLYNFLLKFF